MVIPHMYDNLVYRKTRRPPAAYSPDIRVVAEGCRADGGEEHAIALLPAIFSSGISDKALTRKMTREEAANTMVPRPHRYIGCSSAGMSLAGSTVGSVPSMLTRMDGRTQRMY